MGKSMAMAFIILQIAFVIKVTIKMAYEQERELYITAMVQSLTKVNFWMEYLMELAILLIKMEKRHLLNGYKGLMLNCFDKII